MNSLGVYAKRNSIDSNSDNSVGVFAKRKKQGLIQVSSQETVVSKPLLEEITPKFKPIDLNAMQQEYQDYKKKDDFIRSLPSYKYMQPEIDAMLKEKEQKEIDKFKKPVGLPAVIGGVFGDEAGQTSQTVMNAISNPFGLGDLGLKALSYIHPNFESQLKANQQLVQENPKSNFGGKLASDMVFGAPVFKAIGSGVDKVFPYLSEAGTVASRGVKGAIEAGGVGLLEGATKGINEDKGFVGTLQEMGNTAKDYAQFGGLLTGGVASVGKGLNAVTKNVGKDVEDIFGGYRPNIDIANTSPELPRTLPTQLEPNKFTYESPINPIKTTQSPSKSYTVVNQPLKQAEQNMNDAIETLRNKYGTSNLQGAISDIVNDYAPPLQRKIPVDKAFVHDYVLKNDGIDLPKIISDLDNAQSITRTLPTQAEAGLKRVAGVAPNKSYDITNKIGEYANKPKTLSEKLNSIDNTRPIPSNFKPMNEASGINSPSANIKVSETQPRIKSSRELPDISNMNKAEFESYYGLDQKYSNKNITRLVEDTGAKVINKVGSNDIPTILKHYKSKYNLPENIKITFNNTGNRLGSTEIPRNVGRDANGNILKYNININPNQSLEGKVGTLRHEIEHVIDLQNGFSATKQPRLSLNEQRKLLSQPMNEGYATRQAGEHKNYKWFEADYLRRASVKDALKEGKKVSQEILDEFPDLKNVKPVEKTSSVISNEFNNAKSNISKETQTKLDELEMNYKNRINSLKNDKVMSSEFKQKQIYGEGMKYSAKKRELIQGNSLIDVKGGLTPKELSDKIKYLKSNHSGKEVITPDGEGILTGQSAYGKVGVKIDGKVKYYIKENIQPKIDIDAKIAEQKANLKQINNTEGQITPSNENNVLKNDSMRSENVRFNENQSPEVRNMVDEPSIGKTQGEGNIRERGFSTNEQTNINSNKTLQENLASDKLNYMQLENKSTYEKAKQIYDKGYDESLDYFNSIDKYEPHDVPLAHMIANEASKRGDIETARNVIVKISEKLTEAGQFGQAGIIMRRSDPATYYRYITNNINKLNREGLKRYGNKWNDLKMSPETEREIFNLEIIDEASMNRIMQNTNRDLVAQMPSDAWEKWDTWRRMSMLLNPKTHIRNIVGNGFMAGLRKTSDTLGMIMEKAFVKQGERTKSFLWSRDKNLVQKVADDWSNVKEDLMSNNKYGLETIGGLNQEKRIFKTEFLEKWNKRSSDWLNKEDEFFMGRAYRDALGQYMKANNLSTITDMARTYASRRALEATFRQTNELANYIIKAKKMKYAGKPIDAMMPFTKTPLNIAKSGLDYSPVGIIKTLFDVRKSPQEAIETLSKGLTGTSLMGLGYFLGSMGWARANMEKSKNASELTELTGEQPYSILTPLGSYTFDWNQPSSIPLTIGVTLAEQLSKNLDPTKEIDLTKAISKSLSSAGDSFFNMTVLKNIKDILGGSYGSITEALASLPADYIEQGIPSIIGQVSRSIDDKKRNTYDENPLKMSLNNAMNKTLLSVFLPEKVDVLGETKKQPSWWQQFVSPGTYKETNNDPLINELDRLYESTKKTNFLPKFVNRSFTFDKREIWLKPDEIENFQRKMGEMNKEKMDKVINSDKYINAKSDELKSKLLNKVSEENYELVKRDILKNRGISTRIKKYVIPSKSLVPKK